MYVKESKTWYYTKYWDLSHVCISHSHIVCCKTLSCHEITWCVEYHHFILLGTDSTTSEWTWNLQVWHRDLYRKELQRDLMIDMFVAWVKIGILSIFLATKIWQKKNSRVWTWTLDILSIIGAVIGITAVDGSEIPRPTNHRLDESPDFLVGG